MYQIIYKRFNSDVEQLLTVDRFNVFSDGNIIYTQNGLTYALDFTNIEVIIIQRINNV